MSAPAKKMSLKDAWDAIGKLKRETLGEYVNDQGIEPLIADGFDPCIMGMVSRPDGDPIVCYSKRDMAHWLMIRDGMTIEDANEFLEFNVFGAYVGENGPAYLDIFN
jgi:hypothetical protein